MRLTPNTCGCEQFLTLEPTGTYTLLEQDSIHEFVLCRGTYFVYSNQRLMKEQAPYWDLWLELKGWWYQFDERQLIKFEAGGRNQILTYPGGPGMVVSDASETRYLRVESPPGKPRLPSTARSTRHKVAQSAYDIASAPTPVHQSAPAPSDFPEDFPADTREEVRVLVFVDTVGKVVSAKAIKGPRILYEAAVRVVSNWRFRPGTRDGYPITAPTQVSVFFELPR